MTSHRSAVDAVVAAHEQRLPTIDPLLPGRHPLPVFQPDDALLTAPGAVGLARLEVPDPGSFDATWGAAHQYQLLPRVGPGDPAAGLSGLLDDWARRVRAAAPPGDPETEAKLTWPSRDSRPVAALLAHGLTPSAVVAARPAGRPGIAPSPGRPGVRPLHEGDLPAAAALWREQVRWDAQFGATIERPSTLTNITAALRSQLEVPGWAWVAESGGVLTGLLVVEPPPRAGWIAASVAGAPVAYLSCLVVTAAARGGGAGAALVRAAHSTLDAAGVAVTLLHYAALNPLSGPFWHRCGYRPLWTGWQARPADRLRITE